METHEEVLNGIVRFCETAGLHVYQLDYSPITGPEGNIEFLAEIAPKKNEKPPMDPEKIRSTVREAHHHLLRNQGQSKAQEL